MTQISIRMLRYYDEIGLLKPAKVDLFTGYRMYSAEQIPILQKIVLLRDTKFTTLEIKDIIQRCNDVDILDELEKKKVQINKEISIEKQRIDKIDSAIKEIEEKKFKIHCNISFKKVDKMFILSVRDRIPSYFHEGVLWDRLCESIKREDISVRHDMYNNIAIYHDIEHKDANVDVEVGMLVNKIGENKDGFIYREVEVAPKMAYAMVYGPYINLAKAYEKLAYWIESHNEHMADKPSRQICHIGVGDVDNPEEYLTEIQIPLR